MQDIRRMGRRQETSTASIMVRRCPVSTSAWERTAATMPQAMMRRNSSLAEETGGAEAALGAGDEGGAG